MHMASTCSRLVHSEQIAVLQILQGMQLTLSHVSVCTPDCPRDCTSGCAHAPAPTHFDMTAQMTEHQPGCISGCTCNSTHERADCVMQALRPGVQGGQDGSFRATFEDKPLMSDIVFLRAWIGVDLPRFYNPVTNLLGPAVKPMPRQLKPGHLAPEVRHMNAAACCKMQMREVDPAAIL